MSLFIGEKVPGGYDAGWVTTEAQRDTWAKRLRNTQVTTTHRRRSLFSGEMMEWTQEHGPVRFRIRPHRRFDVDGFLFVVPAKRDAHAADVEWRRMPYAYAEGDRVRTTAILHPLTTTRGVYDLPAGSLGTVVAKPLYVVFDGESERVTVGWQWLEVVERAPVFRPAQIT